MDEIGGVGDKRSHPESLNSPHSKQMGAQILHARNAFKLGVTRDLQKTEK